MVTHSVLDREVPEAKSAQYLKCVVHSGGTARSVTFGCVVFVQLVFVVVF